MFATKAIWLLFSIFSACSSISINFDESHPKESSNSKGVFYNPIFGNYLTPDPFVYFHTDGYYYYSHTTGSQLIIYKSKALTNFRTAENATVYTCPPGLDELWAPEIHFVRGNFYVYFTMKEEGQSTLTHRMYVIQALDNTNPLGNYSKEIRLIPTSEDFYAIDGTVLDHSDGNLYFLWSGSHNQTESFPQKIFITKMSNATSLSGPRILLKETNYSWESKVNEGPEIIQRRNRTFVVYSSYCKPEGANPNYCLLIMHLDGNRDPTVPANWWHKTDFGVFWRNDEQGVYGPGHCSFTTSPDYTESWIVYHAVEIPDDGSWNNRTARAEPFTWSTDNYPIFPRPSGLSVPLQNPSGQED